MNKNELEEEMIKAIMIDTVGNALDTLKGIPDHPMVLATVVGNVVGNAAIGSAVRNKDERAAGEMLAAIFTVSMNSIVAFLKQEGKDIEKFHDTYLQSRITFAGEALKGDLIPIKKTNEKNTNN